MSVNNEQLQALYAQIEQIYKAFRVIRGEADNILETSEMPDSKLQLDDVLAATETATITIINHVTAISNIVSESALPSSQRDEVQQHVSHIFEACGFQDISGQRIKKVMQRLQSLEEQLGRLSESSKGEAVVAKPKDPLLNGPQLSGQASNQAQTDELFRKS